MAVAELQYTFNRDGVVNTGQYLQVGETLTTSTGRGGYTQPDDGTIVAIEASMQDDAGTQLREWAVELNPGPNPYSTINEALSFTSATGYYYSEENTDFDAFDYMKVLATGSSNPVNDPVVTIYTKRRK